MFQTIAESPKPTVARINGAAIGGGLGLVAACDIAIASSAAVFAASEVRLGLIPSTIAPYVVRAIGERHARRLFQTAERFSAAQAQAIGLLHEVAAPDQLDSALKSILDNLLAGAPNAQHAAKNLIDAVAHQPITLDLIENTAVRIATLRSEPEAREGLNAFLEKRSAKWVPHE
jgi:methylglutaconyl-CoA hydratase